MMLEVGPFSDEKFDPRKWINSACKTWHTQDSLDNHMVDLEMKLQMVSEEIAASLEEQSAAAFLRVPRATRDVLRLRDDAVSLRNSVAGILDKLKKVFEASLRATLARLTTSLSVSVFGSSLDQNQLHVTNNDGNAEPPLGGRASLDVATVRLVDVPEKARKVFNLLDQSKDTRFHALPLASQRVAAFAETVNELVYDVLISKVRQRLNNVSCLPIWSAVEDQSAFPLSQPSAHTLNHM